MSSPRHPDSDDRGDDPSGDAADREPTERLPPEVAAEDAEDGQVEPTVVPRAGAPSRSMEPHDD